jgi:hypothetical protein
MTPRMQDEIETWRKRIGAASLTINVPGETICRWMVAAETMHGGDRCGYGDSLEEAAEECALAFAEIQAPKERQQR